MPEVQLKVRLLQTQVDRNAGFVAPKGLIGDLLAFCPNPAVRDSPPTGKVRLRAYKYETEPLEADEHVFYVPLFELEAV